MGNQNTNSIERILQRVEEHMETWRGGSPLRQRATGDEDNELTQETTERERKLVEETSGLRTEPSEALTPEPEHHREVAFVVYSDGFASVIENFRPGHDRIASVVPARQSGGGMGVKGAWLVIEKEY